MWVPNVITLSFNRNTMVLYKPCAYIKTRGLRGAMKEVGVVKRARKVRASAVSAVEEWEEGIPATVVETTGESVEKPTEEVLDKNGVQDMERGCRSRG